MADCFSVGDGGWPPVTEWPSASDGVAIRRWRRMCGLSLLPVHGKLADGAESTAASPHGFLTACSAVSTEPQSRFVLMRLPLHVILILALGGQAQAQGSATSGQPEPPQRTGFAAGFAVTPHWEFAAGNVWLAPGIRLSAPLGPRVALDVEASRLFGADTASELLRRIYMAQVRWMASGTRQDPISSYWSVGYAHLPIRYTDARRARLNKKAHGALLIGRGWQQTFGRRRVSAEVGFSGGDGYVLYSTVAIQLRIGGK